MSRPATFSHADARRLYATGRYMLAQLGERFGVSASRIRQVVNPEVNARVNLQSKLWLRENYRQPCRDCGTLIWKRGRDPRYSGLCKTCLGKSRQTAQHGTETMAKRCDCAECRAANNRARAARRRRPNVKAHGRVGYSNGCRCALCREGHRIYCAERRAQRKAVA